MPINRELNPQLFGNQTPVEKMGQPVDPQKPARGIMGRDQNPQAQAPSQRQVPYAPIDVKNLEHQIATLKMAMIQMEKRHEQLNSRVEEIARNVTGRMERFAHAVHRLEEVANQKSQEDLQKFAAVAAKVNERKVNDAKVQELIDRHNMIVRNFENRLMSLQRIVTEQELALHNAQATVEEARLELQHRRRMQQQNPMV